MTMPTWYAGLMTGTVLDGQIDLALIRTDGHVISEFGPAGAIPYPDDLRDQLAACVEAAAAWKFGGPEPALTKQLTRQVEHDLTLAQSHAVTDFVSSHGFDMTDIAAIGFHGQTILHRPPVVGVAGRTRQLGDGALMAAHTGRPVIFDFRSADMAHGGQGAPLCPVYHTALLTGQQIGQEAAMLNLGGIGNITWRAAEGSIIGFDTGPANAPIDDWVRRHNAGPMDHEGRIALRGTVDEDRVARALGHAYFESSYPKSLDRLDFPASLADGLSLEDGAATLTAIAATAVAHAIALLPRPVKRLIVCGGGRHNPALMMAIETRADVTVTNADDLGWRGDALEAECFAFLAARRLAELPASFPSTTGVSHPLVAGRIAMP